MLSNMKRILVTGGAGFIGSHLCAYLFNKGHKIICVDNLYSGSLGNIKHLLTYPNFKFIKHDIINPFLYEIGIDEIYNLACPASPISYQFDPVYTIKTNIIGSLNMLELAKKNGARILQASTSEIYGDPLEHPQKESYLGNVDPLSPRSCYDEGKRAAETLFFDYARDYNVDVRIIRIFNTYGPKMALNDGRVISNFIIQALKGEDITIFGKGSQTRSFMYVDDLIEGMVKMMGNNIFKGPVNLGNQNERTIKDLAQMVIKFTNSDSKIIYLSDISNDPKKRCPDISLAKDKLNWQPKIDFETGLKETIKYFKERLKIKTHILVFSTVFDEVMADKLEIDVKELIKEMRHFHFHIITGRFIKDLPKISFDENFTVHRIGIGNSLDKYLLVLFGFLKARKLHKDFNFSLAWSVRSTYSGLAALIFKIFSKVPFIILLRHADVAESTLRKTKIISPIYKMLFKKTEAIYSPDDILIQKLKNNHNLPEIILSVIESTPEIRKVKEIHYRIVNKLDKKLVKPK